MRALRIEELGDQQVEVVGQRHFDHAAHGREARKAGLGAVEGRRAGKCMPQQRAEAPRIGRRIVDVGARVPPRGGRRVVGAVAPHPPHRQEGGLECAVDVLREHDVLGRERSVGTPESMHRVQTVGHVGHQGDDGARRRRVDRDPTGQAHRTVGGGHQPEVGGPAPRKLGRAVGVESLKATGAKLADLLERLGVCSPPGTRRPTPDRPARVDPRGPPVRSAHGRSVVAPHPRPGVWRSRRRRARCRGLGRSRRGGVGGCRRPCHEYTMPQKRDQVRTVPCGVDQPGGWTTRFGAGRCASGWRATSPRT